jgi:hypothetical protein
MMPQKMAMGSMAGMMVAYLGWQLIVAKVFATQSDLNAMSAALKQESAQTYMSRSEIVPTFLRLEEKLDKLNDKITDVKISISAMRRDEKARR